MVDWLTSIPDWIGALLRDPESLRFGYSAFLGVAAFLLALSVYLLVTGVLNPLRKRLNSVTDANDKPAQKNPHAEGFLASLGGLLAPKLEYRRSGYEALLRHAGFRSEGTVQLFFGIKLATTVLGPTLVLALAIATPLVSMGRAPALAIIAGVLGFVLPDLVLRRLARRRQDRLRRGLPDAMDLLVVCSEAGLGLGASIQRVAGEISITHPTLADDLSLFSMQTRSGMDSRAALKDLEDRTGLEDIQALVAMLLQSMRFGTSIADTLRIYSDELRDKRLQRAQERAAKMSTILLFPLILCIMPSFFLVVLGPVVLGVIEALGQAGM